MTEKFEIGFKICHSITISNREYIDSTAVFASCVACIGTFEHITSISFQCQFLPPANSPRVDVSLDC